jgi:hypothetical protein
MDPLQWFELVYCSKCKSKSCQPKSQITFTDDVSKKLLCASAIRIMLETDEDTARKLRKRKGD